MDFLQLDYARNRGWPLPENSLGLSPMFGDDGWCRSCGMPTGPQSGSLTLSTKELSKAHRVWIPNWRHETVCVDGNLAAEIDKEFSVELRQIEWRGKNSPGTAFQIVAPSDSRNWFNHDTLSEVLAAKHGVDGAQCSECQRWRWMPLIPTQLPPLIIEDLAGHNILASSEWFGDGWNSFRQIAVSKPLGELIGAANPKDFHPRPWI